MIKNRFRILACFLSLLVLFTLTACGRSYFKVTKTAVFPDSIAALSQEEKATLSATYRLSAAEETLTLTGDRAIALYEAFDFAGCLQITTGEDFQNHLSEQAYIDLNFYSRDQIHNASDAYVSYSSFILYENDIISFPTFSSGKYGKAPEGSFAALSAILTSL